MDNVSVGVHIILRLHHNSTPVIGVHEVFECCQSVGRKCRLTVICKTIWRKWKFINPRDYDKPIQEVIAEKTDGGVDCSIECTGNIKAMIQAFESFHEGWGVFVLVGVPHSEAVFATNPVNFLNERTLKGTFFGNYKPRSDLPDLVELYLSKKLELDKFRPR
jgi:hypothetical protein